MTPTFRNETRFGLRTPGPWKPYKQGTAITAEMTAPTTLLEMVQAPEATQVQWMVRNPGGASNVTAFTVHYGRWVSTWDLYPDTSSARIAGEWNEISTVAITGATDDELFILAPIDTQGDPIAAYVDTFTGSVSGAGQTFKLWYRELG